MEKAVWLVPKKESGGFGLTLALREQSSSTLLGFRSMCSRAGDRLCRKLIPRPTW